MLSENSFLSPLQKNQEFYLTLVLWFLQCGYQLFDIARNAVKEFVATQLLAFKDFIGIG